MVKLFLPGENIPRFHNRMVAALFAWTCLAPNHNSKPGSISPNRHFFKIDNDIHLL